MTSAIDSAEVIQNYLAGRLSDNERRAFEQQLLSDTKLVRELEESLRFREGLAQLRDRGELDRGVHRRRKILLGRAAAAAILVIALGVGLYSLRESRPSVAATLAGFHMETPLIVVERYSFVKVREAARTPVLDLPRRGALELRALTAATGSGQTFFVTLEASLGARVSRVGTAEHLAADADGFVAIYADTARLQPGDYVLTVQPDGEQTATAERFAFRLDRAIRTTTEGN
jgi:hypothetical protein